MSPGHHAIVTSVLGLIACTTAPAGEPAGEGGSAGEATIDATATTGASGEIPGGGGAGGVLGKPSPEDVEMVPGDYPGPYPRVARFYGDHTAAASFTFDDGWASHAEPGGAADALELHGMRGTFYINSGNMSAGRWALFEDIAERGHELGNHTHSHPSGFGDVLDPSQRGAEMTLAQDALLAKTGVRAKTFAYPFCSYQGVREEVLARFDFDRPCATIYYDDVANGQASTIQGAFDHQTTNGARWVVGLLHGFDGARKAAFVAHLDAVAGRDVWFAPYDAVASYVTARDHVDVEFSGEGDQLSFSLIPRPGPYAFASPGFSPAAVAASVIDGDPLSVVLSASCMVHVTLHPGVSVTATVDTKRCVIAGR